MKERVDGFSSPRPRRAPRPFGGGPGAPGGRPWGAYLEGMPEPCFDYTVHPYAKRHNPFMYFESVRSDPDRCLSSVVPFDQFGADLNAGSLPDFVWITPDICNSAHDCPLATADAWLGAGVGGIRGSTASGPG